MTISFLPIPDPSHGNFISEWTWERECLKLIAVPCNSLICKSFWKLTCLLKISASFSSSHCLTEYSGTWERHQWQALDRGAGGPSQDRPLWSLYATGWGTAGTKLPHPRAWTLNLLLCRSSSLFPFSSRLPPPPLFGGSRGWGDKNGKQRTSWWDSLG